MMSYMSNSVSYLLQIYGKDEKIEKRKVRQHKIFKFKESFRDQVPNQVSIVYYSSIVIIVNIK